MNRYKLIINRRNGLFLLGYILLYLSYFVGDINIDSNLGRNIRFVSYGVLIFSLFTKGIKLTAKQYLFFFMAIAFSFLLYVTTGDLYFSVIIILVLSARDIDGKTLIRVSYWVLLIGTICVFLLCMVGVLENVNTVRNSIDTRTRMGWGFYHSNVLPLVWMYLTSYKVLLKKEAFKNIEVLFSVVIGTVIYYVCNSRNAYFSLLFLMVSMYIINNVKYQKVFNKGIEIFAKISLPIVYAFSISMMFLLLKGGIWNTVENFFSGRFRSAIFKSRNVGIHFVNLMSDQDFFADGIILDNGYLYAFLRYGIIAILIILIVFMLLIKKIKGNKYGYLVLLTVVVLNMLDNDLLDYSCLPFVVFAFSNTKKIHKQQVLVKSDGIVMGGKYE